MIQKLLDLIFRIYRIAGRILIKYSSNPRPSSYPYVTGDGFRNFADYVYDDLKTFNPADIKERNIVFVGDSKIKKFLTEIHPEIKHPYILITHNGDAVVGQEVLDLSDDKILKWYGINVLVVDPRVVPIPLGIENKHWYVTGIPAIFNNVTKKQITKMNRIFYGFTVSTNTNERQVALDVLKSNPLAETVKRWLNFYNYLCLLATYKFVASPPGSCVEGHRTWDALYLGVVPVVKSSVTIDYFEKLGIPLWLVKDWHDLDGLSEKDIENKFENIKKGSNQALLYMDYWTDKIRNAKD
ncbi:MAG: hypothetical protein HZB11_02955 [Candidatus Yonathbacteria bacterium]|nr:hypothetical protein [Candidatus Yonathbacteria bacterium]